MASVATEMYRSRQRRKAEVAEKVRALEERVASIEGALTASQQQPPEARSTAQLETSPVGSQRRSSVASTEHPATDREEAVAEHYPVDDIAVRTIHGMAIPEGYARVMVDRVEKGWEDLNLEIPGGDGEEELG